MTTRYPEFEVAKTESLEPNDEKGGEIFARLGYKIADAIADLVDNSVDAHARNVLVRFVRSSAGIHRVLIVDDGHGMDDATLREAMRFGSRVNKTSKQLGKYGIGLKSASLSQADTVVVLSKQGAKLIGRRWTLENIKKQWTCEVLRPTGIGHAFGINCGRFSLSRSATIVIWERLEHLRALPETIDRVLENTIEELSIELGIRFHRFLERKALRIYIDQQFAEEGDPEVQRMVTPLNPFSYPISGHPDYPIVLRPTINKQVVPVKCHIWPRKTNLPGYRLGGGKVALRQGFYFYRNDRVIQAGGWNGLIADDGEPHLSLARVEIDLPAQLDSIFKLDVTKSHLVPAPQFIEALKQAKVGDLGLSDFLKQAQASYRKHTKKEGAKFPCVPGEGLPSAAKKAITKILEEKGAGTPRKIDLRWKALHHDEIVRVDAKKGELLLNARYRKDLTQGNGGDAPVLKLALLLLLQKEFDKVFLTKSASAWLQKVNHALIASLKT